MLSVNKPKGAEHFEPLNLSKVSSPMMDQLIFKNGKEAIGFEEFMDLLEEQNNVQEDPEA